MSSRPPRDDPQAPSSSSGRQPPRTTANPPATTMATAQLPPPALQPHSFAEYAAAQTSASATSMLSGGRPLQSPAGRGQTAYTSTGYTPRAGHGVPEERPTERRRQQGALPISDLLTQEPGPSRRPSAISTSGRALARSSQESLATAQTALTQSPVEARDSPTVARRPFFDPARSLADSDVPMTDATPLPSPFPPPVPASDFRPEPSPSTDIENSRYRLTIRQQPVAARACGHGERDRRVVDPPPILQLTLADYDPAQPADVARLTSTFNIVQCLLHSVPARDAPASAGRDVTALTEPHDARRLTRRLMGTLALSPFVGIDKDVPAAAGQPPDARVGTYYIFHDLSCRQPGLYRLHFSLTAVDMNLTAPAAAATPPAARRSRILAQAVSDVFEVFNAKDFPGMASSSPLLRDLKSQGAAVSVKKGSDGRNRRRRASEREGDGSGSAESDDGPGPGPGPRPGPGPGSGAAAGRGRGV